MMGNFMEQFKTVILLDNQSDAGYAGKILMYSGETRIQDDELSGISLGEGNITFYISAKETSFQGRFNESNTEFSGHFIFPDNSRHPLSVKKFEKDSQAVEKDAPLLKEKIRQSFPVEELKSDFRELVNKLKELHPRLYSYSPEGSFRKESEEILESINTDLSLEEYYSRIAPLVASVRCSHTGIRLPREYQLMVEEKGYFFPLKLYFQEGKAYFLSAPGSPETGLIAGAEIKAINKRPVPDIIEEILELLPAEGFNLTRKYQELNRDFPGYFHMLDPSESFSIDFASSGSGGSLEVQAVPYSLVGPAGLTDPSGSPYSFQMLNTPETGMLKLSSFGIRDMDKYFAFLDSVFLHLKHTAEQELILDLRDNPGGHPIFAAQLLSYLTESEFTYFRRNPDIKEFEPLYLPMKPNPNHYDGRLYVLVNGNCLSTTGHLISLLSYHTEAIFIGEDPGSTYLCNDFSTPVKLTNTGIEANIPRTTFVTAVEGFHEGDAFPLDYEFHVSVQHILAATDPVCSFACKLIAENPKL